MAGDYLLSSCLRLTTLQAGYYFLVTWDQQPLTLVLHGPHLSLLIPPLFISSASTCVVTPSLPVFLVRPFMVKEKTNRKVLLLR